MMPLLAIVPNLEAGHLLEGVLRATLEATVLVLLIFCVSVTLRSKVPASTQATFWVILTTRLASAWLPLPSFKIPAVAWHLSNLPGVIPVWITGMILFASWLAYENLRLASAVRRSRVLTSQPAMELLEACKEILGIRTPMVILLSDRVTSPALFGLIRPRLLIHPDVLERLSEEELRHVILHELAHLHRLDLLWAWLSALLQVVHWFNPLVWLAFRQMRHDRELACDSMALSALPPEDARRYGQTLLKLQAHFQSKPRHLTLPAMAGITEGHFSKRIRMILQFCSMPKAQTKRWNAPSMILTATIACFAFGWRLQAKEVAQTTVGTQSPLGAQAKEDAQAKRPPRLAKPIEDRVDMPFVNDPELLGGWRSVDFVKEIAQFQPGARQWKGDLFLKELHFRPDGTTNWAFTWTKGYILHLGDKTASKYTIQKMAGKSFLFMEWNSGDYKFYGMRPAYYVLEKDDRLMDVASRREDKIDYPFVDDPELIGLWKSVDFVSSPESFNPAKPAWQGELFLKDLELLPGGKTKGPWRWTRGLIIHPNAKTASHYQIKKINSKDYLFFEWKSGDYVLRGMQPHWYVLTR